MKPLALALATLTLGGAFALGMLLWAPVALFRHLFPARRDP